MERINFIKDLRIKALEDKSFYLRVSTWITSGDGRRFCAYAPDAIEFLLAEIDRLNASMQMIAKQKYVSEMNDRELQSEMDCAYDRLIQLARRATGDEF